MIQVQAPSMDNGVDYERIIPGSHRHLIWHIQGDDILQKIYQMNLCRPTKHICFGSPWQAVELYSGVGLNLKRLRTSSCRFYVQS